MAALVAYKGLQIVSPPPTGDGGFAIQTDLTNLVDWSPKNLYGQTVDPTSSLNNASQDLYAGSTWVTNTTPGRVFVCQASVVGAATWLQLLLKVVQDTTPQLGGNLDVNGKQITSAVSNGNIVLTPNGTGMVGVGTTSPSSALTVAGPISTAVATKTAAYTVTAADSVVFCDSTGGAFTVTLPTAAGISGRTYFFKRTNLGSNNVTIAAASGQTIDGNATLVLNAAGISLTIVSDGSQWRSIPWNVATAAVNLNGSVNPYPVKDTDSILICDATGGAFTVTLPAAAGRNGRRYTVKRTNTGATKDITINVSGGGNIDGSASVKLNAQFDFLNFVSDGSQWWTA